MLIRHQSWRYPCFKTIPKKSVLTPTDSIYGHLAIQGTKVAEATRYLHKKHLSLERAAQLLKEGIEQMFIEDSVLLKVVEIL